MKPLDLLPDLTGIQFCEYVSNPDGGFPAFIIRTIIDLDRVGNMMYNEDRSIAIDMEKLKSKAKTPAGVFKSFTQQIMFEITGEYCESEEADYMRYMADEERDMLVLYNKETEHHCSYMWYADGRRRFLYLEKHYTDRNGDTKSYWKDNVLL